MADTVIAPDLRERHERLSKQLRGSKAQQRYAQFTHELIERVSKAEQENVALRAIVPYLQHVPEDIIAVWAKDGKCGECGKQINFSSAYRCYDCGTIHHKECLKTHIKGSDPRSYMCARKMDQELVALRAKLQQISDWCEAYPLDVFTEPDMVEVRRMLGDTLLTQLSAHNFRHVINGVKQIAARGREGE